ncbi:THO complex subunit 5 [Intoshia linei]|uniref:THO complex subunit 5 n=1 Tax=Intoshia linei TaxID=1819745 RepID=A0A177BCY6_9BILA|nr:THO complex subunit 5 [Intoshia linei]
MDVDEVEIIGENSPNSNLYNYEKELMKSKSIKDVEQEETDAIKKLVKSINEIGDFDSVLSQSWKDSVIHNVCTLKKMNRLYKWKMKIENETTKMIQKKAEHEYVEYENLLYEYEYTLDKIEEALSVKFDGKDLDLINEEEFNKIYPEHYKMFDDSHEEQYKIMVSRIEHERLTRQKLQEEFNELIKKSKEIKTEIEEIKIHLSTLKPKLDNLIETSAPIQEFIGINYSKELSQSKLSKKLPPHLFSLYMILFCLSQDQQKKVKVKLIELDGKKGNCSIHEYFSGETKKKSYPSVNSSPDFTVLDNLDLFDIVIEMEVFMLPKILKIGFVFSNNFKIILSKFKYNEQLIFKNILRNLYPDDTGLQFPELEKSKNSLNQLSLSFNLFYYKWVQRISGVSPIILSDTEKSDQFLKNTCELIVRRIEALEQLKFQISNIENNTYYGENALKPLSTILPQFLRFPKITTFYVKSYEQVKSSELNLFKYRKINYSHFDMFCCVNTTINKNNFKVVIKLNADFETVYPIVAFKIPKNSFMYNSNLIKKTEHYLNFVWIPENAVHHYDSQKNGYDLKKYWILCLLLQKILLICINITNCDSNSSDFVNFNNLVFNIHRYN